MRYFCIFFLFVSTQVWAQQTPPATLTDGDIREIRAEAKSVVKTHFGDLLNAITFAKAPQAHKKETIANSYMQSTNQIFYSGNTTIEDDVNPDYTISGKGPGLPVAVYLDNLRLFYTGAENSIKIEEVSVGDVELKTYPYIKVIFKIHFEGSNKQKPAKYKPVYRVAELRADKYDKDWVVLISGVRYHQQQNVVSSVASPTPTSSVPPVTPPEKPAAAKPDAPQKPVVSPPDVVAKPVITEKSKDPVPAKAPVTQNSMNSVAKTEKPSLPENTAAKKTDMPVKTEQPIAIAEEPAKVQAPILPPKMESKKEEIPVVKPSDKSPEITPKESEVKKKPVVASNTVITGLEKRAATYRRQAALYRVASIACVGGGVATVFVLKGSYGKYKTQIAGNNAKLETWWGEADGNGTLNGQNFGSLEDYKAKTKSFIGYGTPALYLAGAGVIAGGILWIMGGKSSQDARQFQKQADQKKGRVTVNPQWDGFQKYMGVRLSYQF